MTVLLKGQVTNALLGSIRVTSIPGSKRRKYLAAVAPPKPPPITTTRGLLPNATPAPAGKAKATPAAPASLVNVLRSIFFIAAPYLLPS